MSLEEKEIKLNTFETKNKYKKSRFIILLFIIVICLVMLTGFSFGNNFLGFFVFYMFFIFPVMVIYSDSLINLIPSNIASYFIDEAELIKKELSFDKTSQVPIYNQDYLVLFLGVCTYVFSLYILYKQNNKFVGIATSVFFCSLSSIIINDIF